MTGVILGSASPRRKELLRVLLRDRFTVRIAPDFEEPACPPSRTVDDVADFVLDLARQKAEAVSETLSGAEGSDALLTADTLVVTEDETPRVLGKPPDGETYEDAVREYLRLLSGTWHSVLTGVRVQRGTFARGCCVRTRVRFARLDDALIDWYVATGEPRGKAGGYAIQGDGGLLVDGLEGSFSNVVGLPIVETRSLLQMAGIECR